MSINKIEIYMVIITGVYSVIWFVAAILGIEGNFLTVVFLWLLTGFIIFLAKIGYTCPDCDKNSLDIQGDEKWQDTTTRKSDGSRDKRYNTTGDIELTLKCKNKKCGRIFTANKKLLNFISMD